MTETFQSPPELTQAAIAAGDKKTPGGQHGRCFNAFALNALTICGKTKTIWTKPEL